MRTKNLIQKNLINNTLCYVNCIYNTKFKKYQPVSIYSNHDDDDLTNLDKLVVNN